MALATQCPHCGTMFRVASDQLKLRGGIVRCGACQEIFDGSATLIDLNKLPPPPAAPAAAAASPAPGASVPAAASAPSLPADTPAPDAANGLPFMFVAAEEVREAVRSADLPAEGISDDTPIYTLDLGHTFDPFGILPKPAAGAEGKTGPSGRPEAKAAPAEPPKAADPGLDRFAEVDRWLAVMPPATLPGAEQPEEPPPAPAAPPKPTSLLDLVAFTVPDPEPHVARPAWPYAKADTAPVAPAGAATASLTDPVTDPVTEAKSDTAAAAAPDVVADAQAKADITAPTLLDAVTDTKADTATAASPETTADTEPDAPAASLPEAAIDTETASPPDSPADIGTDEVTAPPHAAADTETNVALPVTSDTASDTASATAPDTAPDTASVSGPDTATADTDAAAPASPDAGAATQVTAIVSPAAAAETAAEAADVATAESVAEAAPEPVQPPDEVTALAEAPQEHLPDTADTPAEPLDAAVTPAVPVAGTAADDAAPVPEPAAAIAAAPETPTPAAEAPPLAPVLPATDGRIEPAFGLPADEELVAQPLAHEEAHHGAGAHPPHADDDSAHLLMRVSAAGNAAAPSPGAPAMPVPPAARTPAARRAEKAAARRSKLTPTKIEPQPKLRVSEIDEPEFVKRSRQQEQSGRTRRIAMLAGSVVLLLLLLVQGAYTFRTTLAAQVPALKPTLVSSCALLGCRVDLPAEVDYLAIETGELTTLGNDAYSFTTELRNSSTTVQAWPSLELTLTDSNDKPLVRRVFVPRDYLAPGTSPANGMAPRSEHAVKLQFRVAELKPSGYHIAVFYP